MGFGFLNMTLIDVIDIFVVALLIDRKSVV